jgi:predicted Zn-dependent peptidase
MDYLTEDKSMTRRQNFLWLVMAAMLALTSVNAEAKPKEAFRQVTLKNGLHLKYRVMKGTPVVSMAAVIPIGMNYLEKKSIAHLLEHMIFRGSGEYSFPDILDITSRQGGTFSGFTTLYATTYNYVVPNDRFEKAFRVFNSTIWSAALAEPNVALEQKIVLHEADMNYVSRLPGYPLLRYFYPEHSDTPETVYAISVQDLKDFYQSYYQPIHATYIMAGDFDPKPVIDVLEQVKNVYGESAKKISDSVMTHFDLPRQDIVEELNLYPYYYQVLFAYEYSDLSPAERMVLKTLGYLFGYSQRIDYEKNRTREFYAVTRSFGNKDYFGLYYLERNQPFDEESYTDVKANLLKFIRQFKKVDLKKALKDLAFQVELEKTISVQSAADAVEYEIQRLIDPDSITADSLKILKKLSQRDLERLLDKCFTHPPTTCILVKDKAGRQNNDFIQK